MEITLSDNIMFFFINKERNYNWEHRMRVKEMEMKMI